MYVGGPIREHPSPKAVCARRTPVQECARELAVELAAAGPGPLSDYHRQDTPSLCRTIRPKSRCRQTRKQSSEGRESNIEMEEIPAYTLNSNPFFSVLSICS